MPWREIGIMAALVVCMFAISRLGRRRSDDSRSAKLMKKYKTLTPELLADTPDYELVEAVVAHVLAEAAESRKPDPLYTLSRKPQPYLVVYSVWAVCKEMAAGDARSLQSRRAQGVTAVAADGFEAVGAPLCAAAFRELLETGEEQAFRAAVQQEQPLALCETYIRDHAEEFIDE